METNITWTHAKVTRQQRWKQRQQSGLVVWLTGLSGAGKSTLATALDGALHQSGKFTYLLDGDNLRHGLCNDLSFSSKDRSENVRRTGEVAQLMADAGIIVICSLISPFASDRDQVRKSCERAQVPFLEVYVNAPLTVCEERDPKGLYKKARAGNISGFTGIDSPYEPPSQPEIEVRTDLYSPQESLQQVMDKVLNIIPYS